MAAVNEEEQYQYFKRKFREKVDGYLRELERLPEDAGMYRLLFLIILFLEVISIEEDQKLFHPGTNRVVRERFRDRLSADGVLPAEHVLACAHIRNRILHPDNRFFITNGTIFSLLTNLGPSPTNRDVAAEVTNSVKPYAQILQQKLRAEGSAEEHLDLRFISGELDLTKPMKLKSIRKYMKKVAVRASSNSRPTSMIGTDELIFHFVLYIDPLVETLRNSNRSNRKVLRRDPTHPIRNDLLHNFYRYGYCMQSIRLCIELRIREHRLTFFKMFCALEIALSQPGRFSLNSLGKALHNKLILPNFQGATWLKKGDRLYEDIQDLTGRSQKGTWYMALFIVLDNKKTRDEREERCKRMKKAEYRYLDFDSVDRIYLFDRFLKLNFQSKQVSEDFQNRCAYKFGILQEEFHKMSKIAEAIKKGANVQLPGVTVDVRGRKRNFIITGEREGNFCGINYDRDDISRLEKSAKEVFQQEFYEYTIDVTEGGLQAIQGDPEVQKYLTVFNSQCGMS